ncbi:MAG: endo-1,4-beta-xylanase [Bacteroidales bacterium]|nr:endo-1,4-beta-xylanase [Bacteroidales bacterium]
MKKFAIWIHFGMLVSLLFGCQSNNKQESLKEALKDKFYIGVALNDVQIKGKDTLAMAIVKNHFNSIVAENCMKMEKIHPVKDSFSFELPDAFVNFGIENNMKVIGHCLIWHSQVPSWIFIDEKGKEVTKEELIARMKNHITTIVSRYKGRVHGWDVVNEAIDDNGQYRQSKWYTIIGPEYIELAFKFAHEADPNAELYYNDYNEWHPVKRDAIYNLVKGLKEKGIKVDGIGMQGHLSLDSPTISEYEQAIEKYASLGVKVMITELDLTLLPWPSEKLTADVTFKAEQMEKYNPYPHGLPDSVNNLFTRRYSDLFNLFIKHADKIDRVTLWGVYDTQSWRNYWPIMGRTDYPLLFDRQYQPKPVVDEIIKLAKEKTK